MSELQTIFTRREANTVLLAAVIALAGGGKTVRQTSAMPLFDFAIAGRDFYSLPNELGGIDQGTVLELRREPFNPYDANAIAVHMPAGAKLGFVPRSANPPVAALLDRGERITATVVRLLPISRWADIPDDLVYTSVAAGDPVIRLMLEG
jgi:hypothetical protein